MNTPNKNLTDLAPAPGILPVMLSTPSQETVQEHREGDTIEFFAVATDSFQAHLNWIEKQGQRDSPAWHLTNGLLRRAQGLQQDHEAQQEHLKSFARSCRLGIRENSIGDENEYQRT